jgi:predicted secreted protein
MSSISRLSSRLSSGSSLLPLGVSVALMTSGPLQAQTTTPPQNVVVLSASASVEVNKDWLSVVFSTTREGADAPTVQAQLRSALEAAVAEAKKIAKPGQVELRTGGFSLSPRYAPPTPKQMTAGQAGNISGWQGSTELTVEGRDTQAIAQLTGRVQTLSIASVSTSLSREARQQVEGDVAAQAITRFRERAGAVTKQFGFDNWSVREVSVTSDGGNGPRFQPSNTMAMRSSAAEAVLPVEAGKATVTANVSGSVQMK